MKKRLKALALTMAAALALSIFVPAVAPVNEVYATKTVKAKRYANKAKSVKKGTTIVKAKYDGIWAGLVKFKAPKKGTYRFTISDYKGAADSYMALNICRVKNYSLKKKSFKTPSSKKTTVSETIFSKKDCKKYSALGYTKADGVRSSTYVQLKLKKGQTIYIASSTSGSKSYRYKLKIKKR